MSWENRGVQIMLTGFPEKAFILQVRKLFITATGEVTLQNSSNSIL